MLVEKWWLFVQQWGGFAEAVAVSLGVFLFDCLGCDCAASMVLFEEGQAVLHVVVGWDRLPEFVLGGVKVSQDPVEVSLDGLAELTG